MAKTALVDCRKLVLCARTIAPRAREQPTIRAHAQSPTRKQGHVRQPHLHLRGSRPSKPLSEAHPVHSFLHSRRRRHAARGGGRAHRGQHRGLRAVFGILAYACGRQLRLEGSRDVACAHHQRRAHGHLLFARRLGSEVRGDGGRAHQHPSGAAAHHGRHRRRGGAHRHLFAVQPGQSRNRRRLGRAHGDRHRLRARHPGAFRQSRAGRRARVFEHARRGRRHHRHPGHRHLLRPVALACMARGGRRGACRAHRHEPRAHLFARAVSFGGLRAVVLHIHVRRAFDHRRRAFGVHHSLRLARQPAHVFRLVGDEGARGARGL